MLSFLSGCLAYHRGPLPGEPRATYTHVDGVRLHYQDSAETHPEDLQKPVVVLVHGFAASLNTWTPVVPALSSSHRILRFDMKGFGWSERPEGDYSNLAQARLLLGLMKQRGITRAALVGHSWGTSVVLAAVAHAPRQVERIALIAPYAYNEQIPTLFQWARAPGVGEALFSAFYRSANDERIGIGFHDRKWVTQELVDSVEKSMALPGTVAAALASARGQDFSALEPRYRHISQPALIMVGREDTVATPHFARRLSRDLRNAELVEYQECAHFPMIEAHAQTNRDLVAFLRPSAEVDLPSGPATNRTTTQERPQEVDSPSSDAE